MTAAATLARFDAAVDSLQQAETWAAWKLGERESDALPLDEPETLDEAVRQAMGPGRCWNQGDRLAVQHTHAGRGKRTLWLFNVKRSTTHFDYRPATDGGAPVRVGRLYPVLLLETALAADFAPVLRFDAFRDDAVGVDRSLVEARS